jgi:hypothetical protein
MLALIEKIDEKAERETYHDASSAPNSLVYTDSRSALVIPSMTIQQPGTVQTQDNVNPSSDQEHAEI